MATITALATLLSVAACAACATASAEPPPGAGPGDATADEAAGKDKKKAAKAKPGTIVVEVSGFRNEKGQALIALFTTSKGFPDGKHATIRVPVKIEKRAASTVFDGLPPGTYAVSVLHDEDGDYEMATSFLGIPEEGYGASNNARRRFGPPEWEKARFELASGGRAVQKITLIYH